MELLEQSSHDALPLLLTGPAGNRVRAYMLVYVDGLHLPQAALWDAVLSWRLLAVSLARGVELAAACGTGG